MKTRSIHFAIALGVFVAEILVATTFSHIRVVRSSVGDYLVVILIYHLVKGCRSFSPLPLAVGVFLFACLVEGAQYVHLVDTLGLRRRSLLAVLIGNSFSWSDILMYFLGCLTSWQVDARLISRTTLDRSRPVRCG
jgi:hypothetical protein